MEYWVDYSNILLYYDNYLKFFRYFYLITFSMKKTNYYQVG